MLPKPTPPCFNVKKLALLMSTDNNKHSLTRRFNKLLKNALKFQNLKKKSVFNFNAVGMAKLFASLVPNKTYPEELHGFIFSVTTNSELVSFPYSIGSHDEDDNVFSSLFSCVIGKFSLKKMDFLESTLLTKICFLETSES